MFTQDICEGQLKSNYLLKKNRYSCLYLFSVSMLTLVAMITGGKSSNAQETNSLLENNRSSLKNNQSLDRGRRSAISEGVSPSTRDRSSFAPRRKSFRARRGMADQRSEITPPLYGGVISDLDVVKISQQNSSQSISANKTVGSSLLSQAPESPQANNQDLATAQNSNDVPEQIVVKKFQVVGSTIFSKSELDRAIKSYRNRPLTLPELFQARSIITKLYTDKGYVNSGAYIPPQELNNGTVKIEVLEGELEGINVSGTKHLSEEYISSRIEAAAGTPVNVESLLAALQLLRLDPLIDNVSAELSAGIRSGTSLLDIQVEEADVFNISTSLNNNRSPSVGSNQRSIGLNHGNLFGFGDQLNLNYTNTEGSDSFDFAYAVPINSKNGTIRAGFGINSNDVVEEPFATALDIESASRYYELNLRQPLVLQPNKEFALGMSFSRVESDTRLGGDDFPLSRGVNDEGETRISAIRLFQEYVNRDDKKVLAFRSQFSIGVDAFNATSNEDEPDSTFLAWRGQSQWVRKLGEDFLFLLRGDIQLSGGTLVPLEQFRVGGVNSARGYRQDLALGDNGIFTSAELRIPILRFKKIDSLVQIAPFLDLGTVWNSDDLEINNSTLPAVGIGLNFSTGNNFNARLDWGIPLVDIETDSNSLQEDGIYFSLDYSFF